MAPEGKDNVKGQACLGCKRNSLRPLTLHDLLSKICDKAVFFHSQQPYTYVQDADLAQYPSGRLDFPNRYFDPGHAHVLYNQYHEQYAWADGVGLDGIMTNEYQASYWNMKPSANLDAAVLSKVTTKARIAILGNILPISDPVRMAEELAMLDCYSGGRLISGFVRG